ncbi:MAG TPA: NADPH-dependent FMN reductase [Usitatibacter sp.]|jgi:chromate reductase|nr:NADPH-dependent FMN reductase [Usitatibacter sp.]
MAKHRVAVLIGSLRKESFSRRLALALCDSPPESLEMEILDIGDLPLYNQDLETDSPPPAWTRYRTRLAACEAVLFVTPEYNRGMSGAIKNAIDVGSRPYGKAPINRKPCAVASSSPGALGGFGANHQVRQCVVFLDMPMMQMPELYVGQVDKVVDASGKPTADGTRELFGKFLQAFATWIEKNAKPAA